MKGYAYAECTSNLPPDPREEDDEVTPGGRGAANAIAQILRALGYRVEGPTDEGDHGWDLNAFVERKRIWLEVQGDSDEFWLQSEAMVGFFGRMLGADLSHYRDLMQRLNQALGADPRFKEIRWFETRRHQPVGDPLPAPPL